MFVCAVRVVCVGAERMDPYPICTGQRCEMVVGRWARRGACSFQRRCGRAACVAVLLSLSLSLGFSLSHTDTQLNKRPDYSANDKTYIVFSVLLLWESIMASR